MKTLQKTYTGKYAPNHLEFDYWIDLTADAKGSVIKTYNGMGWTEISGDSGEQTDAYTKAEVDSKFDDTNATVASIQDTVDLQNTSYFTAYYDITDISTATRIFNQSASSWLSAVRAFVDGVEVDLNGLYDTVDKCFKYQFSKEGVHCVTVYILSSIGCSDTWNGNTNFVKLDLSTLKKDVNNNSWQIIDWLGAFASSELSEITFPNGFLFASATGVFGDTHVKELDISNFDGTLLTDLDFLGNSSIERLVMRGMVIPNSLIIPTCTIHEVIIQNCDMSSKSQHLFLDAAQISGLEKIDLSGSKLCIANNAFASLPESVKELILDGTDFSNCNFSGQPLEFGYYSGILDLSKCEFNYADPFFTNNPAYLFSAPNCSELIWDGLELTRTSSAPLFYSDTELKRISFKNAKINVTNASGLFLWYNKDMDVDLTGATISGNINGLCVNKGKVNLDRVTFTDATCTVSGPPVCDKPIIDLTTASGSISAEGSRPFFQTLCTVYYNSNLDLSSVINNAETYGPTVIFIKANQGVAAPNKISQLYNDTIGCTAATTTASLVTDKNLVVATISANDAFSLASVPAAGKEIHTIVKNSGDADVVVTIPTESPYVNLSSDSLTVAAGGHVEINVISDGTNVYIRTL